MEHNSVGHNTGLGHVWVKGQGLGLVVQSPHEETSQPMWVRDVHLGIVEVRVVIEPTGHSSVLGTREPWAKCPSLRDGQVEEDTQKSGRGGRVREAEGKPREEVAKAKGRVSPEAGRSRQHSGKGCWLHTNHPLLEPSPCAPSKGTPPPAETTSNTEFNRCLFV